MACTDSSVDPLPDQGPSHDQENDASDYWVHCRDVPSYGVDRVGEDHSRDLQLGGHLQDPLDGMESEPGKSWRGPVQPLGLDETGKGLGRMDGLADEKDGPGYETQEGEAWDHDRMEEGEADRREDHHSSV